MPVGVHFVLLRPRNAENLGASARALKNFGLGEWTLVEPFARPDDDAALRRAVHAEDTLQHARTAATLDEAVAQSTWVVATSSHKMPGKRRLSPREFAAEAVERISQGGQVSLVFGDERSGLRTEEIERCHDLSVIPTSDAQPSVNLSQAVLLYAYELGLSAAPPRSLGAGPRLATDAELRQVATFAEQALEARGFLNSTERHAVRDLLAPLTRARLTQKEARLWCAALQSLKKGRG